MGLKPIGTDGTYFQPFQLATATVGPSNHLALDRNGVTLRFHSGQDFFPLSFSASAEVEGQLAFAGYGISAPNWDTTIIETWMYGAGWSWCSTTSRVRTIPRARSTAWS